LPDGHRFFAITISVNIQTGIEPRSRRCAGPPQNPVDMQIVDYQGRCGRLEFGEEFDQRLVGPAENVAQSDAAIARARFGRKAFGAADRRAGEAASSSMRFAAWPQLSDRWHPLK